MPLLRARRRRACASRPRASRSCACRWPTASECRWPAWRTLERIDGPVKIERENSARMAVVRANVRGRDLVGFVEEAKAAVAAQVKLPPGYRLTWGGQFENQQRAAAAAGDRGAGGAGADLPAAVRDLRLGAPGAAGVRRTFRSR